MTGEAAAGPGAQSAAWHLRPAVEDDAMALAFLELEIFPDEAWTVFQLAEEIAHPDRRYVVAVTGDEEILGYAGIMIGPDTADLHTIGTGRPGHGIGQALLAWCEREARATGCTRMLLEVREDNDRARAFYTRADYREIGRRRGYYRIGARRVDAIVMEGVLDADPEVTRRP